MMILRLSNEDRNRLVKALSTMSDEYREASEALVSHRLRREFENDAIEFSNLAGRVAGLTELLDKPALDVEARKLFNDGYKIEAIKLVRANTTLGLKEAKDYVEAL